MPPTSGTFEGTITCANGDTCEFSSSQGSDSTSEWADRLAKEVEAAVLACCPTVGGN